MDKAAKRKLCSGCREDYYNQPGNSTTGECWMLSEATLVERTKVGIWQDPPYQWTPQQTLSCHRPAGCAWIKQDDPRIK